MKNNILSLLLIVLFPFSLFATNGIFTIGTGIKSKALGGAAQATYDHAFGSANNPASLAFSKDQLDLNLEIFMPARGAERVGGLAGTSESEAGIFPIPEFGYRSKISK